MAEAGFRLVGLEIPVISPSGRVVIDAVLFHEDTNHLVQCESKAGANVEDRQACAYAAVTAKDVVQAAYVDLKTRAEPTLETLYVCLAEHVGRIKQGVRATGLAFPVLAIGQSRIELHDNENASQLLRDAFASGVELSAPPARIIPFDHDTLADVIKGYVLPTLVGMMASRVGHVSLTSLTEQTAKHYPLYGHGAQQKLRSKVEVAVRDIVMDQPENFAYEGRTGRRQEGLVRFLRTPEDFDLRGRTQAYQAIGRQGRPSGRRRPQVDPNQLDLLEELDAADTGEEDSLDAPDDREGGRT
ncbi:MAG TPA: hypothetical protein VFZ32_19015 [Micromonosporaceae bacterium]